MALPLYPCTGRMWRIGDGYPHFQDALLGGDLPLMMNCKTGLQLHGVLIDMRKIYRDDRRNRNPGGVRTAPTRHVHVLP